MTTTPEVTELLDALSGIVYQHCLMYDDTTEEFDSEGFTTDANAMRVLAKYGRFQITGGAGSRIFGKLLEKPRELGDQPK